MAFDMNQLFENPGFVFGASLLSNPRGPDAMNNAFGMAQKINAFKQQRNVENTTLGQTAARDYNTAQYQQAETEGQKAKTAYEMAQNQRLDKQSQMTLAMEARKLALQEGITRAMAQRFGIDPSLFSTPAGSMTGQLPPDAQDGSQPQGGAQPNSAQYNIPPNGHLNTPPIGQLPGENPNGLAGGAQFAPSTPAPVGMAAPQPIGNFNPDSNNDPAGPMNNGTYGQHQLSGPGRIMLRSGAHVPPQILNRLQQVESGGNPNAVNAQTGAEGPYQFLPSTQQMLAQQGHPFNARDPQQSRAAADFYLSQLAQKHGGDLQQALADYGGFKTKDPTGYTARILSGAVLPPAKATGIQSTPAPNPGLQDAQLGALMAMAGIPGGQQMADYGKMEQPQSVPAGGYQRLADGTMQFVGDPYKEAGLAQHAQEIQQGNQRLGLDAARLGNENAKTGMELTKGQQDIAKEARAANAYKAADTNHVANIDMNMSRMSELAGEILKSPGLSLNTGVAGAIGMNRIPGTQAKDTAVQLETLKNKLVVDAMTTLKEASKTGSTGFGQLSEREGQRLETMIANLDNSQSEKSMRKQLQNIVDFSEEVRGMAHSLYQDTYKQEYKAPNLSSSGAVQPRPAGGGAPTPQPAQPAAAAGGAMSLNDYIAKHRK